MKQNIKKFFLSILVMTVAFNFLMPASAEAEEEAAKETALIDTVYSIGKIVTVIGRDYDNNEVELANLPGNTQYPIPVNKNLKEFFLKYDNNGINYSRTYSISEFNSSDNICFVEVEDNGYIGCYDNSDDH